MTSHAQYGCAETISSNASIIFQNVRLFLEGGYGYTGAQGG